MLISWLFSFVLLLVFFFLLITCSSILEVYIYDLSVGLVLVLV